MALVAAFPILLALVLLVGFRRPAIVAMPICAAVTTIAAWWLWQVPAVRIGASMIEAVAVTLSILLIVFGALLFLALLRGTGAIAVLQRSVGGLSTDVRIQAVLVGWILGSFLEGGAGFGTPAAITAPLLISLGFRPLPAVVVALVGDSTAVSFGAVGTPMVIGMGRGLVDAANAPSVNEIAMRIGTLDVLLGTLMPVIVVLTLVVSTEGLRAWRRALPALPFAAAVGLTQAAASWMVVTYLGPEFPSLLGPMAGFVAAVVLLRLNLLVPRQPWSLEPHTPPTETDPSQLHPQPSPWAAFAPYLLLLVLLVLTRTRALPLAAWLSSVELGAGDLFGTGIAAKIQPLYSPGAVFILCTLASAWILRAGAPMLGKAVRDAGRVTLKTAVALVTAIITVRIFLQSGGNAGGHQAMPLVLADALAGGLGGVWPATAPWIGALGSFISGSATFSNMLFALLQLQIAVDLGYEPTSILALQGIGAAAGNMVCIHNVVAACAVAGILGQEGNVIRRTAAPMILYLLIAGAMGMLI